MKNFNFTRVILVLFIFTSVFNIHGISERRTPIDVKKNKNKEQYFSKNQKNRSTETGICFECGNGTDGVYSPAVNADLPGGNYQFSSVNIPAGVIITVTGSEPLNIQCTGAVIIDGIIRANGGAGGNGITYVTFGVGGTGVAGGSNGGNGVYSNSLGPLNGFPGTGMGGGQEGAGWSGGGGGGHLNNGSNSGGVGGNGGISYGDPLAVELLGGSGGGGGSGGYSCGAGGGGAGGGIIVITSCLSVTIGSTGSIECKGGNGGSDGTGNCGAGGGGSGGSIRLNSPVINNNGSLNVDGGTGGQSNVPGSPYFGNGGNGSQGRTQINISNPCCFVDVDQPEDQIVCNNTMTAMVSFSGSSPGTVFNWTNSNPSIGLPANGVGDIAAFTAINTGNLPQQANITVTPTNTNGNGSGTVVETFNYTGNVQTFTVPAGVTSIKIEGKGAQGGNSNGGLGAHMTGTFSVIPGDVLSIVVGQQGVVNNCGGPNASGGGGGGTFVWNQANPITPLIVAGGGGGGNTNWPGSCTAGIDASTSTSGTKGNGTLSADGGTLGQGGFGNAPSGTGSGGAGWLSSGQNSTYGNGCTGGSNMPLFTGGNGATNFGPGGEGGFGGGGGAVCGCGGGGGYSGGGGGEGSSCRAGGGGGGSFNAGTNQNNIAGAQIGNGQVVITYTSDLSCNGTPKTFTITVNPTPPAPTISYAGNTFCSNVSEVQLPTVLAPIIDGVLDANGRWGGPIAVSDDNTGWPNDGPSNPFGNNVNVNDLYVTSDAEYVYFGATINSAANWQSWGFAINTIDGAGGSSEVWTFPIVYGHPQLPDFVIKGHFGRNDPGPYAELRKWSGSSWNQINNAGNVAGLAAVDYKAEETGMVEVRILKSILGNPNNIDVQFYISGDNQGEHGTFDAVPDDQVADSWNECCPFNVLDNYVNNIQVNGVFSATPAGITVNATSGAFIPNATTPNTYTVTYTIPGSNGCPAQTASTIVTVESLPSASIVVEENSGTTNDGDICNGQSATLTAIGAAKNCLNFNGSNYIEAASTPTISLTNALTVEAWIKTDNAASTQYIVTKGTDDLSNGQYGIVVVGGKFQFHLFQSGHWDVISTTIVQSGVWYHVAGTWDGTTIKIYVNGVMENQGLFSGPMTSNNQTLRIGNLGKPNFQYHFRGNIDEVRIWNTARSAAQIQANYNKLVSSSATLAAYYRLDEGSGSMTVDMANANNATLFNSPAWLVSSAPIQHSFYNWSPAISLNTSNGQSVIATPSTTTTYTVTVTSASGCINTASTTISVNPLPCGWSAEPNGVGCNAGNSVAYNFNTQRFIVTSTNCYYPNSFTSDALAFAQYDLCGNGSISAQVTGISPLGQGWAGVTMRESNAAGAKKAQLMTNLSDLSRREFRTTTNGQAYPQQFPSQNRYWLRITRTGNQFVMYVSPNGTTWYPAGAQTIVMGNCIEMGLVVTNYVPNSTVTATFANVSVTGNMFTRPVINTLEDQLADVDFSIVPNPTNGWIAIDLSAYQQRNVQMELYNIQGKLLRSTNFETGKGKEEIDLTAFASGMYLIRVRAEGLPDVTRRLLINRTP